MTYARLADGPESAVAEALHGDAAGLLVATSGSSGTPREVLLGTESLRASAEATHARLSGPGRWLLALPENRIAGAQVLVRSFLAETTPVRLVSGPFDPAAFASGVAALTATTDPGVPLYTSLVPTQLHRILASESCREDLDRFNAVLVGGAPLGLPREALPPSVIETYGATETAGGCVYDGIPLDGVQVEVDDSGRVTIGGMVIADGYADDADSDTDIGTGPGLFLRDDVRWYRTPDAGVWAGGSLAVVGRLDDVIVSGGFKVHPTTVETALLTLPGIEQAVVVGVPDSEWGERVVALVVGSAVPTIERVRGDLLKTLPRFALPREIRPVGALPLLESGKIDRKAARRLA
ncbi:MAG: AMP-binding protein [Demequinaceae bacterium]|nr:AMP-binding protein [Demequinaceae bacterium]